MLARRRTIVRKAHPATNASAFEALESRQLMSGFSWTAHEVYLSELVNRARANPAAEGQLLGIDLTAGLTQQELLRLVPSEPLALNEFLTQSSRAHALDMAERDFFDHVNPDGLDPTDRAQAMGYTGTAGENIAAGYVDVDEAHAAWLDSLGHRKNVLSLHATFDDEFHYDEFGPGMAFTNIGPFYDYYAQLFGVQAPPERQFLLGVVYNDANQNNFYTIGEGMANVRIDVSSLLEPWTIVGTYTTDSAGNYQIPMASGAYIVRFTNTLTNEEKVSYVSVGDTNVKVDAREADFGPAEDRTYRPVYARSVQTSSAGSDGLSASLINQHGEPVVLVRDGNDQWTGYDLKALTGSPAVVGQVVSWTDSKDGRLYAAAAGPSGVILFSQSQAGTWTHRNLTTETGGVSVSNGQLVVLPGADGVMHLAGLSSHGKLVMYSQNGEGEAGAYGWGYTDLATQHLEAQGQMMPDFVGDLTGYVTSWNGLNVAGLDTNGQIHSVWWAPGLDLWQTSNLSAITGAPAFVGGLTAYMTPWDGINLAGITEDGSLSITWWVPELGGVWMTDNLTELFDGPPLIASSVTSYVSSWGGINIAGIDEDGNVVVYWWSPENTDSGWEVAPLSDSINGAPVLEGRLMGLAAQDGSLSVFGYAGEGTLVRYYWTVGGEWAWEDVTLAIAS